MTPGFLVNRESASNRHEKKTAGIFLHMTAHFSGENLG
jgi:hypothetical protein